MNSKLVLCTKKATVQFREAFKKKKKKNVTNVTLGGGGGGLAGQNVTLTKVVFKIHFKPF